MSEVVTAGAFIERLADMAETFGEYARVGGMETAGQVVSYLAEHPDWLGAFMKDGVVGLPGDFYERGRLTWHAKNGKIVHPQTARHARIIRKLATPSSPGGDL